MSKRSRDGSVLLDTSQCVLKRPSEYDLECQVKRQCLSHCVPESLKRSADFDIELNRMHKRLRATVPTAEEAIAFLIPHMTQLRKLYCDSQCENANYKKHLTAMNRAYQASLQENGSLARQLDVSRTEVAALRRQVDMMKYRFALSDTVHKKTI